MKENKIMKIRPWSENIWFSPRYVIQELESEVLKGTDVFDRKLKRHREAWICAISVICYAKDTPAEWWIQVPKNDPPDVLAMYISPNKKGLGNNMVLTQFEVFEINEYNKDGIEIQIEEKMKEKDYSSMVIIGYVRKEGYYDFDKISRHVQELKPDVVAVCLIVFEEKTTNCSFIQVFPAHGKIKEDYKSFCKTTNQKDFTETSRSTKIKWEDNTTLDRLTLIPD